ncbi:MAG: DUF4397 domain-containing protein [Chloroflexota bacterium]
MNKSIRRITLLFIAAVVMLFSMSLTVNAQTGPLLTHVRFAHLSPDTPAVEIYIDGERSNIESLTFGDLTGWIELPAGTYNVAVAPAGTSIDAAAIGPANFSLPQGGWVTVAAIGSLNAGTLRAATVNERYSVLEPGEASVTVFHAIEDAPTVDVILPDGTALVEDLAFGRGATLTVPQGTYDLAVVPANATSPVVIDLSGTALNGGTFYFVAAANRLAAPQVVLEAVNLSQVRSLIDKRLQPSIVEIAAGDSRFDTLVTALQVTGLDATLAGEGPFTVFAPTDTAFAALPPGTLDSLIADPSALADVLLYHVVPGRAFAADVVSVSGLGTALGPGLSVTVREDGVFLNGNVEIIITDLAASNGVIHVIDAVLIPPQ